METAGRTTLYIKVGGTEQAQNVLFVSPEPDAMSLPSRSDQLIQFETKFFVESPYQMKCYIAVLARNGRKCPYQKVDALVAGHLADKKYIALPIERMSYFSVSCGLRILS